MATTLANISIKDSSSWNTYLNLIYPVGSYYLSTKSTSPATIFGGSWSALTGRFLYCNNSTSTGGNNDAIVVKHNHSASSSSAGSHRHATKISNNLMGGVTGEWTYTVTNSGSSLTSSAGAHTHTITVASKGVSGTNANMPQYQACYAWYRTA